MRPLDPEAAALYDQELWEKKNMEAAARQGMEAQGAAAPTGTAAPAQPHAPVGNGAPRDALVFDGTVPQATGAPALARDSGPPPPPPAPAPVYVPTVAPPASATTGTLGSMDDVPERGWWEKE
jgi:hypothetical protein